MYGRCNDHEMRRGWHKAGRHWGGAFGPEGPFGPAGPFGPDGPFGPSGPFGPNGPFGGDGGGDRFGRRGERGGGSRRGRRMFDRAELRLVLLRLISEQPRHGYDLIKAMEELSSGHYSPSPGVIYPALAMLADEGVVAEQESEDHRRSFAITDAGRAVLEAEREQADAAMERLTGLGERAERRRSPSIERGAANLFMAVAQRMRGEREEDLAHRIAAILDEAAQRIERL